MVSKFEVGKKYTSKLDGGLKGIYKSIFVDEFGTLLRYQYPNSPIKSNNAWVEHSCAKHYEEYKEPVIHKRWVHFYKPKSDDMDIRSYACEVSNWLPDPKWYTYLGNVPVEFKEEL